MRRFRPPRRVPGAGVTPRAKGLALPTPWEDISLVPLRFQPAFVPLLLAGRKTSTVRTKRYGAAGDPFEVEGARFVLVSVEAMTLQRARDVVWREEGFDSPEAFERAWTANHPTRGFRGSDQVWVHRFRRPARAP